MTIQSSLTALADAVRSKAGVSGKLTIDGMTAAVNGITVGGGGMDFYECASVINASGSGQSTTQSIGIRITSDGGSPIDGDYYPSTGEKKFESASGQYFAITSGSWRICEANGYAWGSASGSEDDTIEELCSKSWYVEMYTCTLTPIESSGAGGSDTSTPTWSGYQMEWREGSSSPAGWYKTDTLTEGLEVKGYYPVVGKVYNADTTIEVKRAFDGVLIPINENGLVFYAPLKEDFVDKINGAIPLTTAGTFSTFQGMKCLQLNGTRGECIEYSNIPEYPQGMQPFSYVVQCVLPQTTSDWKILCMLGSNSTEVYIGSMNGRINQMGQTLPLNEWMTIVYTRANSGNCTLYVNGSSTATSSNRTEIPASPSFAIGNLLRDSSFPWNGYIGAVAVYTRELSAAEVLEIHNTLMEGVTA